MSKPMLERNYFRKFVLGSKLPALVVLSALLNSMPAVGQDVQHGKDLFQKLQCAECHSVAGMGGCLGPALDGVMNRRDNAYVRLRLNKDDESSFHQTDWTSGINAASTVQESRRG